MISKETGRRITALHPNAHFVLVSIGETVGTMAECLNPTNRIKQITIRQHSQEKGKKHPLPDDKKRGKGVSTTQQEDNYDEGNIETTG